MKKLLLLAASLIASLCAFAQITTNPAVIPLGYKGKIVVTFDPTGTGMAGETTCYAHTGVTTTEKGNWTCAPDWKTNTDKYKLTKSGTKWVLTIDDLHTYYDCAKNMEITGLNFVFRNQAATKQTGDILYPFGFEDKPATTKTRPSGITDGIFYDANDPTKVTVSLYVAPSKSGVTAKNVYIMCDANNWNLNNDYQCYKDGNYFWYTFTGLTAGKEYAFQYGVKMSNGSFVQMSDPYSTKVLHGDDQWEPKKVDPTLMDYPNGGSGYVTVIQPGKKAFAWSDATKNFKRPNKNNLVIYELWPYIFASERSFKSILQRLDYFENLGVNAIEFMPLCEFDGNLSWGYSPNHYFAIDKAYGTEEQFKTIVDECHKRGIAVIVDMVFNHATGNHALEKLYGGYNNLKDNPYFNVSAPHGASVFEDWNHDYAATKDHLTRALKFWMQEYKVDGFRMDLSHGFCGPNCNNRVSIMNHYYNNGVKAVASDGYFILEHWEGMEERGGYVNNGMMCWENTNNAYMQLAMGWLKDGDALTEANKDGYVSYTSSHDEQRPFWKAKKYGNGTVKTNETTRLNRVPATVGMCAMLNGPQMFYMFDELGYDYSFCSNASGSGDQNDKAGYGSTQAQPCYDTDAKPIPETKGWYTNANRMNQYKKLGQLIQLRTRIAPNVFAGNPTSSDLASGKALRSIIWGSGNNRIFIIANLSTSAQSFTLPTGNNWYDYLAGSTSQLAAGKSISLLAGEIKAYTASKYTLPDVPNAYAFVGIEDVEAEELAKASIYPSITSDFVKIDSEEAISEVQVVALSGAVYTPKYTEEGVVDVDFLEEGMYLLVVRFQTYERAFKFIKE